MADQSETSTNWQQSVIEKTLLASVTEQRRTRRWGIFFKVIILGYIIFMTLAL